MPLPVRKRLSSFELFLALVVLVVGWSAFRLYQIMQDLDRDQHRPQTTAPSAAGLERAGDLFRIQQELNLDEDYMALANHMSTNIAQVHVALLAARKDPAEQNRYRQFSTALLEWLRKQGERITIERLDARSQKLKERLAHPPVGLTFEELSLHRDLGTLGREFEQAYTNYLGDARAVLDNARQPLMSDLVNRRLDAASKGVLRVQELAREARADAATIERFAREQVAQGLTGLTATKVPSEPGLKNIGARVMSLQSVLSVLCICAVALSLLFMVAAYRRTIVNPLRLRLVESNSVIEHQKKLAHFGQLAAAVGHEIRNPLTAINARLYTLQKALKAGTPEHEDADVIRGEIARLDGIVRDFLLLARPAEPKPMSLATDTVLREVAQVMAPALERQSVQLRVEPGASLPFRADLGQVKQVLINLVRNAADSITNGGTVTLRARSDGLDLGGKRMPAVVLDVQDTGSGIPVEIQDRLFDPFFSTKDTGTGLGLAIAARIIDKHGGRLTFDTGMGSGTTFHVILPAGAG